ncbi:hypothetical protein Scep_017132 [Stephania cephalantha]|uniref:Uncharacterized protein n=1 Tax=Stephania cephalantha TaxID=152367 RepID=A0AAP0INW0_9MAGN
MTTTDVLDPINGVITDMVSGKPGSLLDYRVEHEEVKCSTLCINNKTISWWALLGSTTEFSLAVDVDMEGYEMQ